MRRPPYGILSLALTHPRHCIAMKKRHLLAFMAGLAAAFLLAVGIGKIPIAPSVFAQQRASLTVSAAISLSNALQEIKPLYEQSQQSANIKYNFGASGALQQQIEQGAPVDVFVSAALKQMDALQQKGLIVPESRRNLLTNRLVLVVPQNGRSLASFKDLIGSPIKRIAVGEPKSVPAGQYAEEVFKKLGILEQVKPKLVYGNNVRQVLTFVETGNVDAGIVYLTDAKESQKVRQVATAPENLHSPIVYPIAVVKNSKNLPSARGFVQFLSGDAARAIFEKYGFSMAG